MAAQDLGVECNGQCCKAEAMENRDNYTRLLSPPVAALPRVQRSNCKAATAAAGCSLQNG